MHTIAAKAVSFKEALSEDFKRYQEQIIKNAKALAEALSKRGYRIVTGGTDNHLFMVDLRKKEISGKDAAHLLDQVHITVNKNLIPFDPASPMVTSGLRIGTPAVTTRGMKEKEMALIAARIDEAITHKGNEHLLNGVRDKVTELTRGFLLYQERK